MNTVTQESITTSYSELHHWHNLELSRLKFAVDKLKNCKDSKLRVLSVDVELRMIGLLLNVPVGYIAYISFIRI